MSNRDETAGVDAPVEASKQRYPWLRALMVLVLYGALIIFLWNFPTEGGRAFFQTLFRAFLYIGAGLVLVGVTVLFVVAFPLPRLSKPAAFDADVPDNDYLSDYSEDFGGVFDAQAFIVPAIDRPGVEEQVWTILDELESEQEFGEAFVLFDPDTGIIAVMEEDDVEVVGEIGKRLKRAGITFRAPR